MQRIVMDTNRLRSVELEDHLRASTYNYALITEYTAMEAYKTDNPNTLYGSMSLLSKYPTQVKLLKGALVCCGIVAAEKEYPDIFIDRDQTEHFSTFVREIELAEKDQKKYAVSYESHKVAAQLQMSRIESSSNQLIEGLTLTAKLFDKDELATIISGEGLYSESIVRKLVNNTFLFAEESFRQIQSVTKFPNHTEVFSTFIMSFSICAQVYCLHWIQRGRQQNLKSEKLGNDQIDINYAAFGLCFDGLMTDDIQLLKLFKDSKILQEHVMAIK